MNISERAGLYASWKMAVTIALVAGVLAERLLRNQKWLAWCVEMTCGS